MRIAIITHVYPPEVQSMGVMVRELAEELTSANQRVTVITGWPNHPRGILFEGWRARFRQVERDPAGFRLLRCGHSIRPRNRMLNRLMHYVTFAVSTFFNGLASGRLDAVINLSTPIFGFWSAWLLARCKGARFIYHVMDLHPESARYAGLMSDGPIYRFLKAQDTLLCRKSDRIITLGEGMKQAIVDRGVSPDKVKVLPFWLDASRIRPGNRDNAWRRANGIPLEKFVALYAGTIGYVSGAEVLIETAQHLSQREDILILCVGEGVVKDQVEKEAARLGLSNLRFLPFQPEEVLSDLQATADVGLVTLLPESGQSSIPSKVLGYLAAARPVIASVPKDSDTEDLIHKGGCGIVVPCQDAAALADAIRHAADHRNEVREMGKNARQFLLDTFSREASTRRYLEAIRQMCAGGG